MGNASRGQFCNAGVTVPLAVVSLKMAIRSVLVPEGKGRSKMGESHSMVILAVESAAFAKTQDICVFLSRIKIYIYIFLGLKFISKCMQDSKNK